MSSHPEEGGNSHAAPSDDRPPFAELYGTTTMTPRMAYWLWSTGLYMADTWRGARDNPELLQEWLPPIARPLAHGEWLDQFIGCLDALADRIATGTTGVDGLSRCTGEEMALHLIIDLAEAHFDDDILGPEIGDAPRLPNRGDADENFDLMRDVLFKDNDVLMLNDPMLDGIDDPESDLARIERTVNLHPRDWFRPFAG